LCGAGVSPEGSVLDHFGSVMLRICCRHFGSL
jgi:hypothetical protein